MAALRRSSREIVEAARPRRRPISYIEWPCTLRSAISSRSTNERYRPERGLAEDLNIAGGMPPAFRNHLVPKGCDTPASSAASSLLSPWRSRQNLFFHPALQQTAALAMARTLVLIVPIVAFEGSPQPPTLECCDDRLIRPYAS